MDEKEFKKLAANSRDWLIYQLLSEKSKETVVKELVGEKEGTPVMAEIVAETRTEGEGTLPDSKPINPKGETSVEETITGKVVVTTSDSGIIWTNHNGVKYKTCKYKCGNYVSWNNDTNKYIHYDAEFKLIGADCPKYGGS